MRGLLAGAAALLLGTTGAFAHAVSIGYENAGPGTVNIWLGTYNHGGHHLEGSLNLLGVNGNPFASTTVPFSLTAGSYPFVPSNGTGKPAGLVDGTTNFYTDVVGGVYQGLTGTQAPFLAQCPACGPVEHWQGVQFSSLTPVGSSRVDLQACKLEYSIVSPK